MKPMIKRHHAASDGDQRARSKVVGVQVGSDAREQTDPDDDLGRPALRSRWPRCQRHSSSVCVFFRSHRGTERSGLSPWSHLHKRARYRPLPPPASRLWASLLAISDAVARSASPR